MGIYGAGNASLAACIVGWVGREVRSDADGGLVAWGAGLRFSVAACPSEGAVLARFTKGRAKGERDDE